MRARPDDLDPLEVALLDGTATPAPAPAGGPVLPVALLHRLWTAQDRSAGRRGRRRRRTVEEIGRASCRERVLPTV